MTKYMSYNALQMVRTPLGTVSSPRSRVCGSFWMLTVIHRKGVHLYLTQGMWPVLYTLPWYFEDVLHLW